jgi:hypothetical protein
MMNIAKTIDDIPVKACHGTLYNMNNNIKRLYHEYVDMCTSVHL